MQGATVVTVLKEDPVITPPASTAEIVVSKAEVRRLRIASGENYILGKTLGSGSYGVVREARSKDEKSCPVAIKMTPPLSYRHPLDTTSSSLGARTASDKQQYKAWENIGSKSLSNLRRLLYIYATFPILT